MTALAQRLEDKYFPQDHPYRLFERGVDNHLRPTHTLLDAGYGRTAPILAQYKRRAQRLIGVDLIDFAPEVAGIELLRQDLRQLPLESNSVDLVMARSVIEHVTDPRRVYRELYRVLKPGGHYIFLTANLWDYASLIAKLIPNRFHPWIVSRTEGREAEDVFPVAYRSNTRSSVSKWATDAGYELLNCLQGWILVTLRKPTI